MGEVVNIIDLDAGEPPADLVADVRGLPKGRAYLMRFVARRAREVDAVSALEAGRSKLAERIAKAEQASQRQAAEVDAEASSVVEQIRRGLEWTLSTARKRPAEVGPDLSVAKSALAKLDGEIAAKRETIAVIDARLPSLANAALVEHAAKIGKDYQTALDAARAEMTKLEGLNVALERGREGRLAGEMPGYIVAGHRLDATPVVAPPSEVAAAAGVWRSLARAWMRDPRADASKLLKFSPHDPDAPDNTSYHERSPEERKLIDARFAANT